MAHLRERVVPYIRKIDGNLPKDAIIYVEYFIEEIFADSLIKFYELFETGNFETLGHIRGLMFRIAELKLKEGYKKVKRDQMLFFAEESAKIDTEKDETWLLTEEEQTQRNIIVHLEKALSNLPQLEKTILLHYARGEKLKNIAQSLSIKETACRKKKQRSLDKLRVILKPIYEKIAY